MRTPGLFPRAKFFWMLTVLLVSAAVYGNAAVASSQAQKSLPRAHPDSSTGFHAYSYVEESDDSIYFGGRVSRPYANYHGASCAYDPLWLRFGDVGGWMEVGIAHGCPSTWSYSGLCLYAFECTTGCTNGNYSPGFVWSQDITVDSDTHTLQLERVTHDGGPAFEVSVDGVAKFYAGYGGSQVHVLQTGLESYDAAAVITIQHDSALEYKLKGKSSYQFFSGRDFQKADQTMCGAWLNDHLWAQGENVC